MIVDYERDHCHRLVALRSDKASERGRPFDARPPGIPNLRPRRSGRRCRLGGLHLGHSE